MVQSSICLRRRCSTFHQVVWHVREFFLWSWCFFSCIFSHSLDLMIGGDLKYHLNNLRKFPEQHVRFYAAETLLGLEALHRQNIIYRYNVSFCSSRIFDIWEKISRIVEYWWTGKWVNSWNFCRLSPFSISQWFEAWKHSAGPEGPLQDFGSRLGRAEQAQAEGKFLLYSICSRLFDSIEFCSNAVSQIHSESILFSFVCAPCFLLPPPIPFHLVRVMPVPQATRLRRFACIVPTVRLWISSLMVSPCIAS